MKGVILAAGIGKRMRPLTYSRPKVLLPIAGRPFLDHILHTMKKAGIEDITLVVGYGKKDIKDRYGDGEDFEVDISYVEQPEQKGTADAISFTDSDETFVVINGDVYCDIQSLQDTIELQEKEDAIATVGGYRVEDAGSYGVRKTDGNRIKKIVEKPSDASNRLINGGIYVFEPEIYEAIRNTPLSERGEREITTSIEHLIGDGGTVCVSELSSWIHIGKPWELLESNKHALENQNHYKWGKIENGAYVGEKVTVEEEAYIRSGSYIEGPTYIGRGSDIGPNCYIRPHTSIGKNARIGNAVEVKNSIIMEGSHAAHHAYIGDSVIGTDCNFGAGTKVGNLRLGSENVIMNIKGEPTDTGRRKLGVIMADGVETGVNSMINPGVKMGPDSAIGPGVVLYEDLPANKCIFVEQKYTEMEWKDA